MKKLISLLISLILTIPMWGDYTVSINGAVGYNGVSSVSAVYYNTTNSVSSGTTSVGTFTGKGSTLSKYVYTSSTKYTKDRVYCITVTPTSGNEVSAWSCSWTQKTSTSALTSSSSGNVYYAEGNKIYFKTSSTTMSAFSCTATITASSGSGSGGGGSVTYTDATPYTTNGNMKAYDMGTGGNIYWGDHAIGASNTSSCGLYYRYGRTSNSTTADNSDWYTGQYTSNSNLPAENDIATRTLGEGWRMPTKTEFETLIGKVTFVRTDNNDEVVEARYLNSTTSKKSTIYLFCGGSYAYNSLDYYSGLGRGNWRFWTSTKNNASYAYMFDMSFTGNSPFLNSPSVNSTSNYYACQVIPVYDTRTNYTLTIKGGVDGSSTLKTNTGKWGATTTCSAPDIDGYTFTQWSDGNTTQTNRTFYTCDMVITAQYEVAATPTYTVSFNKNQNDWGSLSSSTSITGVSSGTSISVDGSSVTIGNNTPITATPADATAQYTYSFTGWTDGNGSALPATVTGNLTIRANFSQTENNYSVTFRKSADDQAPNVKSDYHYGDDITNRPATDPQRLGDDTHTYTFVGWHLEGTENTYTNAQVDAMTVSGNMVFTASFDEQIIEAGPVTYNITIGNFTANANGKVVITSQGNTQTVSPSGGVFTFGAGKSVTIQAVPNAYYHFNGWVEDNDEEAVIDIRTLGSDLTYTPTFANNTTITLEDNHNQAYYTTLYSGHDGEVLTVIMQGRQLTEGSWMTFCAPFDFDIPAGHPFRGAVYELQDATMSGTNTAAYISLDFRRTYVMHANVPYLIVPTMTTLSDLEFDHVTIDEAPAQQTVTAESGQVQFISLPWQTTLINDAQKPDFYLATGNNLRYVKTEGGTTFRAFRSYFHRIVNLGAPRRVVISLDGVETTKELTEDGEVVDVTEKRIENGILIIERNGVRYNAQGQVAE